MNIAWWHGLSAPTGAYREELNAALTAIATMMISCWTRRSRR
jgi:hypothetical protein